MCCRTDSSLSSSTPRSRRTLLGLIATAPTCRLMSVRCKHFRLARVANKMISVFVGFSSRRFDEHQVCTALMQCSIFEIEAVTDVTVDRLRAECHQRRDDGRWRIVRSPLVDPRYRPRTSVLLGRSLGAHCSRRQTFSSSAIPPGRSVFNR